jgi:metal-responsive CopG/Arc/MetJ family transcriptional regulator
MLEDKKKYKNQSDLIRTALTRLMNESQVAEAVPAAIETILAEDAPATPITAGDVILVYDSADDAVLNKLHKIERQHASFIKSKTVVTSRNLQSVLYVYEGALLNFQAFTTALNSIKDIKNLRYLILE